MEQFKFAPNVRWRLSKRGLVLVPQGGAPFLLEHEAAHLLATMLTEGCTATQIVDALDQPDAPTVVAALESERLIRSADSVAPDVPASVPRVKLTRSGIELAGIARVAASVNAILPRRFSAPTTASAAVVVVLVGGFYLVQGEPSGPRVSERPAVDALIGFMLGLVIAGVHELAHAVALVRFGQQPASAGIGFYWGALSWYVDSSAATALPMRQRVIQALAGLVTDIIFILLLATAAHTLEGGWLAAVLWRVCILSCVELVVNTLPILQVDGHWALSDLLDEPDMAPRARQALGRLVSGRRGTDYRWAAYGALSLLGGFCLLMGAGVVWWGAAGDLIKALLDGSVGEIALALVLVLPLVMGLLASALGLVLEVLVGAADTEAVDS